MYYSSPMHFKQSTYHHSHLQTIRFNRANPSFEIYLFSANCARGSFKSWWIHRLDHSITWRTKATGLSRSSRKDEAAAVVNQPSLGLKYSRTIPATPALIKTGTVMQKIMLKLRDLNFNIIPLKNVENMFQTCSKSIQVVGCVYLGRVWISYLIVCEDVTSYTANLFKG